MKPNGEQIDLLVRKLQANHTNFEGDCLES